MNERVSINVGFTKIPNKSLPTINLDSGREIQLIEEALITFCQREIGEIANIFTDKAYREFKDPEYDETELVEKKDPYKFKQTKLLRAMEQNEKDAIEYHKSRIKLYGTIISMTSTEVDEKLLSAPDIDVIKKDLDPLELWKSVVGILVSKSLGNSRVDQAIASAEWSNLKQGDNESVLQYKQRTTNLLSTLKIVGLKDIPPADQAVVFTLGLNKGFESLLAHLSNMQAMGTDLYEKDLTSAARVATKWKNNRKESAGSAPAPAHSAYTTTRASAKKDRAETADTPGPESQPRTVDTKIENKCFFCNGDHIRKECLEYKKYLTANAAGYKRAQAEARERSGRKGGDYKETLALLDAQRSRMVEEEKTAMVNIRRTDSDEEETGFLPYPYFR